MAANLDTIFDGQGNVSMPQGAMFSESFQDNIIATPSGTQSNSVQMGGQTSRIATVATAGDGVRLPASRPGLEVLVINHGANPVQVYGSGFDKINDVAFATGVSQMQNSMVIYSCATSGNWYSEGLAGGYVAGFATLSSKDAITAGAGNSQAVGLTRPLTSMINRIVTIATTLDSVALPAAAPGLNIVVINAHAANSLSVWPFTGDAINALAANAAYVQAPVKTVTFYSTVAGIWHTSIA